MPESECMLSDSRNEIKQTSTFTAPEDTTSYPSKAKSWHKPAFPKTIKKMLMSEASELLHVG